MREEPIISKERLAKFDRALLKPVNILPPAAKQIIKGFGLGLLKPKLFIIDKKKLEQESETYQEGLEEIGYDKKGGLFGLPVWDTVRLTTLQYTSYGGNSPEQADGYVTPQTDFTFDIALLEVSQPRNIIKTSIAGRNGTIKEYMSDGDHNIKIRGCIYSQIANRPPNNEIRTFNRVMSSTIALDVECNLLNYLGVYNVVVENWNIKQREGVRNVFDVEVDCLSDTPSELERA